jgi:hypothetical protein
MTIEDANHTRNIRTSIMLTVETYFQMHKGVKTSHILGALSACLCDALLARDLKFDDNIIESIRKTYELCEIQAAMDEKENNSVQ